MTKSAFDNFISNELLEWSWIKSVDIVFAANDYYDNAIVNTLAVTERIFIGDSSLPRTLNLPGYISSVGQLGQFILDTKKHHGLRVAFLALLIGSNFLKEAEKLPSQIKKSTDDLIGSYDYSLAMHLIFEFNQSANYIAESSSKKIQDEINSFRVAAKNSLNDMQHQSIELHSNISEIARKNAKIEEKTKDTQKRRLRRYRKIFEAVKNESNSKLKSAHADLTNAYDTYHAQVDLKSSIVYWGDKVSQHNTSKSNWLKVIAVSIALTFLSPVAYYTFGGITHLSKLVHPAALNPSQNTTSGLNPDNKTLSRPPELESIQATNLALSITDLTGAALLVALLSVFLRLSLRQYNMCIYLGHDAEERVTMLKTYLALSNEGKLSSDADMKLVLEALFRASQSNGVAETSAATPIELIIKAITEKR